MREWFHIVTEPVIVEIDALARLVIVVGTVEATAPQRWLFCSSITGVARFPAKRYESADRAKLWGASDLRR